MAKYTYMRTPQGTIWACSHPEYHPDCENLGSGEKGKQARREYCKQELRSMLKPGDTVYCMVRSVSSSGMSRTISLYIIENGKLRNIDGLVVDVLDYRESKRGGFVVNGCGMDMCFGTVYNLGRYLFPDGFGIDGKDSLGLRFPAPLTKQAAENAVKRGFIFRGRNGDSSGWDSDGGYALKHSTL